MKKTLKLAEIRIDGGTQQRGIDEETCQRYADCMMADIVLPPIELVYDGKDYWLWDGFHRYHAAGRAGLTVIEANIRKATKRDAVWLSYSANAKHGFPRTADETQYIIERILQDKEWKKKSLRAIANHVGVSYETVRKAKKRRSTVNQLTTEEDKTTPDIEPEEAEIEGIDGRTYKAKKDHTPGERGLLDKAGRRVPDHLKDVFLNRHIIEGLTKALKKIHDDVLERTDSNDQSFVWLKLPRFKADFQNLHDDLKAAEPYAVCPYCGGEAPEDCKACKGHGFVTKLMYDAAPKELKKHAG